MLLAGENVMVEIPCFLWEMFYHHIKMSVKVTYFYRNTYQLQLKKRIKANKVTPLRNFTELKKHTMGDGTKLSLVKDHCIDQFLDRRIDS